MRFAQVIGEGWLIPLIGLVAAGVIAFVGLKLLRMSKSPSAARPGALGQAGARRWRGRDRRAFPRARAKPLDILIRSNASDEPQKGRIVDRSLGGVGLELSHEVDEGGQLQLRMTDWDVAAAWVTVEVRHCRRRHGAWHAGCRFVDMSAWEGINIFGPPDPDE